MTVRPFTILAAAVALTGLNAVKPAVVDDTAYLFFARHLAEKPLDPYGWQLFWYDAPQPAMHILLPPVLPYWLAAGIRLFGEHLLLLKLWLFPFAWLLCGAVAALLARFGPGAERSLFLVFVCSPAVLPLFNVMLDIPALSLGAAAIAMFVAGMDRRCLWRCAAAGVLAGLAMQTKYSMLVTPVVMALYAAIVAGSWRSLAALVVAGVAVFGGWELCVFAAHGESHFWHHFTASSDEEGGLMRRFAFAKPLLIQFGGLACGLSLVAGRAAGWPAWVRVVGGAFVVALFAAAAVVPFRWVVITGTLDATYLGFLACGGSVVVTVGLLTARALACHGWRRDTLFLMAWVAVETLAMLGMTPFPAARRLVGVHLAVLVLVAHGIAAARVGVDRWAVAVAVAVGGFVFAVDCWDAYPEKVLVERAAECVRPTDGETVWYTGHWGFQYYAERHGMTPIEPTTRVRAGDWLVLPVPDGPLGRPPGVAGVELPAGLTIEPVADLIWDDGLRVRTIPELYSGAVPVRGRDGPRLRVTVGRVVAGR